MRNRTPNITDAEIYNSADILLEVHGPEAVMVAAMRAEELLLQGNLEGYRMWKRIAMVVDDLFASGPPDDASVH